MKNLFTLLICLFPFFLTSQIFYELCESENTNGVVVDMEMYKDKIYATGFFSNTCGESTSYIAEYGFDQVWHSSEIELEDAGHNLRVIDDDLYITRYESSKDSNWVYVYDGANLSKLGTGVYLTTATNFSNLPNIYDVIEFQGNIIACGEFDRVGSQEVSGIMQWDGTSWSNLGEGLSGNIDGTPSILFPHQMLVHNDELYVVGNFKMAGSVEVNGVAKWNGTEWSDLNLGFDNTVYAVGSYLGDLFVGGAFTTAKNGDELNRIALWDGSQWINPGFGFTQPSANDFIFVHTLYTHQNELYVAGGIKELSLETGDVLPAGGIIKTDLLSFNTFQGGVANNDIEAIVGFNDLLLIGGGVFGTGYYGTLDIGDSTADLEDSRGIILYPNPTSGKVSINSDLQIQKVELFDLNGRLIHQELFSSSAIDFSGLEGGIYLAKIKTDNKIVFQKIILE